MAIGGNFGAQKLMIQYFSNFIDYIKCINKIQKQMKHFNIKKSDLNFNSQTFDVFNE
jgi:hypothetical protein